MDIKIRFGNKIKSLRERKGFSQEKLAHIADLDRTYISGIERGERNVSIQVVEKLAKAFEIEIKEIFE